MKIFLALMALCFSLFAADAESAAMELDYHERYDKALKEAKAQGKKLLVVVVQDPCPFCDKLVHRTLADDEVKQALEGFVGVVLDKRAQMPKQFKTSMTPMTFFVDPKTETSVWETLGYAKKPRFLEELKEAQKAFKE